ncbi:MAG: hypothetical protein K0Q73_7571 [Paenibacillus sp.]|jgi:hypothetical protein|nr:hypothetical protein [Paenibacillus sp.]
MHRDRWSQTNGWTLKHQTENELQESGQHKQPMQENLELKTESFFPMTEQTP